MNNNKIITLIIFMICISILATIYIFSSEELDKEITNINWYKYNIKSGTYDILNIGETLVYKDNDNEFDNCKAYKYNRKKEVITLDCNKKIYIREFNNKKLFLNIDNIDSYFFTSPEDSLSYEFELFYDKSILEYSNSKKESKEIINIDKSKFNELYSDQNKKIIIFNGDNCNNIDCTLFLGVLEKWIVDSNNVYYINSNLINKSDVNSYNKLNEMLPADVNYYNSNYPLILVLENKEIKELKYFKCTGFDCTFWKDYAK